jgi:hypothetical protein
MNSRMGSVSKEVASCNRDSGRCVRWGVCVLWQLSLQATAREFYDQPSLTRMRYDSSLPSRAASCRCVIVVMILRWPLPSCLDAGRREVPSPVSVGRGSRVLEVVEFESTRAAVASSIEEAEEMDAGRGADDVDGSKWCETERERCGRCERVGR